jgi:trimeric autotransporter adhesin
VKAGTPIGWYTGSQTVGRSAPAASFVIGDPKSVFIDPTIFVGRTGNWYIGNTISVAFVVNDPAISIKIVDQNTKKDVTGKSVPAGAYINFRIDSNLGAISLRRDSILNGRSQGFATIKVKTSDGTVYSHLYEDNVKAIPLTNQFINFLPYYWVPLAPKRGWATEAFDARGNRIYKAGVYTVWVECNVNGMKDNYKDSSGSRFTGKTVSTAVTITISSDIVKIEASKDIVVRGYPFSVTITGMPNTPYLLWVEGTSLISNESNQPPTIIEDQDNVRQDPITGPFPIGDYAFQDGAGRTIRQDVAQYSDGINVNGIAYYAQVTLSNVGTRTIGFRTTTNTKDQTFTIRVERQDSGGRFRSDDVDVTIRKGAVTIVAAGDQNYNFGEKIQLFGTNSESSNVYLFITGPNLPSDGARLTNPSTPIIDGLPNTFESVDVQGDRTWQYRWRTANLDLEAGVYTIYAVASPNNRKNLANALYGTVSIILGTPIRVSDTTTSNDTPPGKKYHVALSFAGEERKYVKVVADTLKDSGINVFFDEYAEVELWGKNLILNFEEIFSKYTSSVVIFASKNYVKKVYPSFEKDAALATAINAEKEYILMGRFDDTPIPGILPTIKYINLQEKSAEEFASLIIQKLKMLRII